MNNQLIDNNNQLYYELALMINQEMYNCGYISFGVFKSIEDIILKQLCKLSMEVN